MNYTIFLMAINSKMATFVAGIANHHLFKSYLFFYEAISTQKFQKFRKPQNANYEVPTRNFWRVDDFGSRLSTRQKFRMRTPGSVFLVIRKKSADIARNPEELDLVLMKNVWIRKGKRL